jgi:hypothetical protein
VNVGVVITVSLVAYQLEVSKGIKRGLYTLVRLILKSDLPDLAGIGIVNVYTGGSGNALTLAVYLTVSQTVNTVVVLDLGNARILTGVKYRARSLVLYVEVTVSVTDDAATALSVGINVRHSALAVCSYAAAVLVYTAENSGVPDVIQLRTGSFGVGDLKFFFSNEASVCTHIFSPFEYFGY